MGTTGKGRERELPFLFRGCLPLPDLGRGGESSFATRNPWDFPCPRCLSICHVQTPAHPGDSRSTRGLMGFPWSQVGGWDPPKVIWVASLRWNRTSILNQGGSKGRDKWRESCCPYGVEPHSGLETNPITHKTTLVFVLPIPMLGGRGRVVPILRVDPM